MAISYRNGAEVLVEWRQWKDAIWSHCRYASNDKTKCSARLCPCYVARVSLWMNTISGYLGTVKLVKYLGREDGNGNGDKQGSSSGNGGTPERLEGTDQQVG